MKCSPRTVDFNKQLLLGEVGALVGTPLFPLIAAPLTRDPALLSFSAVVGGLVGGSVFWLIVKVYDEQKEGPPSLRRLAGQIAWFSPAAFIIGLLVYQPTLFLLARWLIQGGTRVVLAVVGAQVLAFAVFLVAMNLYRRLIGRLAPDCL